MSNSFINALIELSKPLYQFSIGAAALQPPAGSTHCIYSQSFLQQGQVPFVLKASHLVPQVQSHNFFPLGFQPQLEQHTTIFSITIVLFNTKIIAQFLIVNSRTTLQQQTFTHC